MAIVKNHSWQLYGAPILFQQKIFGDDRGWFFESYNERRFAENLHPQPAPHFVQDNHSSSAQYVLRGLHYQIRHPQGKLVRCVRGELFDVAIDLRKSSPTFLQVTAAHLSAENHEAFWIPPGYAHGFLALSERTEMLYKTTDYYDPTSEVTILWNDPTLAICWPLPTGKEPLVSPKDRCGIPLNQAELFE